MIRAFSSNLKHNGRFQYVRGFSNSELPADVIERIAKLRSLIKNRSGDISIDTRNLFRRQDDTVFKAHSNKPIPNPLAKDIASRIMLKGPITIAEYMHQALQHPEHGYYSRESDKFGKKGDFITAPEISQLFGEMIAIWCIATWRAAMPCPKQVSIVEFGPGRGTLMADMIRSFKSFPDFYNSIEGIHLLETSLALRKVQSQNLGVEMSELDSNGVQQGQSALHNLNITWHRSLQTLNKEYILLVAQELLDALPVHQFEVVDCTWRERLIDIDSSQSEHYFRYVLSTSATPAVRALLEHHGKSSLGSSQSVERANMKSGDSIEVCPLAIAIVQEVAKRIAEHGGGALFIDYGEDFPQGNTVRAFKAHKEESIFFEPGMSDITADVDFSALSRCVHSISGVKSFGPIPQGAFLQNMGVQERAAVLVEHPDVTNEQAENIFNSLMRLMKPDHMGTKYKVLAVVNESQSQTVPGFPSSHSNKN